jgi:hypothetical protein
MNGMASFSLHNFYAILTIPLRIGSEICAIIGADENSIPWGWSSIKGCVMIARDLLILAIGIFVGGNLGILTMCLIAMAKRADEQTLSAELTLVPIPAQDAAES